MALTKEDLSQSMNDLLVSWQSAKMSDFVPRTETKIKVNEVVSKLAFLYEKIRYTVDFKEEHLLRKNAIERILKMRMVRERRGPEIANNLLRELIRGGYLPNNKVPETKIQSVALVLAKHALFINEIAKTTRKSSETREIFYWMMNIAACEIESIVAPSLDQHATAATMYRVINDHLVLKKGHIDKRDQEILLYISVYKTLLQYDDEWLEFVLWKLYVPHWEHSNQEAIIDTVRKFREIRSGIRGYLKHKRLDALVRIARKYTVLFQVIRDIYDNYESQIYQIISDPKILEEKVKEACKKRYHQAHVKLRRSAVRSILYIFITKMVLALCLEIPYDMYFTQVINRTAIIVNIIFPPLLMCFAALLIRVPSESNTRKIMYGVKTIMYKNYGREIPLLLRKLGRNLFLTVLFGFVYFMMFLVVFGLVIAFLLSIQFNILSITLFLFFVCVVSFFAFRIRNAARSMVIEGQRDLVRTVFVDFLSLPFLRAGRFLSTSLAKVNFFMFLLDFVIEAPFKSFIEIFEELLAFIKEKKEEV